jgi:hypothetical protein
VTYVIVMYVSFRILIKHAMHWYHQTVRCVVSWTNMALLVTD